jgi:hypothetical protein
LITTTSATPTNPSPSSWTVPAPSATEPRCHDLSCGSSHDSRQRWRRYATFFVARSRSTWIRV